MSARACRQCGCTDNDCSGCIARTGQPCSWVDIDLCSACAPAGMCQCEHVDHEDGTAHAYLAVPAGDRRADHVGAICDECATGHLAEYLL